MKAEQLVVFSQRSLASTLREKTKLQEYLD